MYRRAILILMIALLVFVSVNNAMATRINADNRKTNQLGFWARNFDGESETIKKFTTNYLLKRETLKNRLLKQKDDLSSKKERIHNFFKSILKNEKFIKLLNQKSSTEYSASLTRVASNNNISASPEPATILLFGAGLIGIAGYGRKKFKKKN